MKPKKPSEVLRLRKQAADLKTRIAMLEALDRIQRAQIADYRKAMR